ncbi:hypothetical protein BJ875DRAFT_497873 [Amylocarpus encephaloides]|uniref:Uncharacterized protein n=1 Tax=Amylocarpus encephaloides TaxID=45428 RepID=A0A9P7YFD7_9HELO|nr:hypothetical protein BJ875DRAFT_497873 [Amylocarpus encephaloides]
METPKPILITPDNFMNEDDMKTPKAIQFKPAESMVDKASVATLKAGLEKGDLKTRADLTRSSRVVPPTSISSILRSIVQDILTSFSNTCTSFCLTLGHIISLFSFLLVMVFMIVPNHVWDYFVPLKLDEEKQKKLRRETGYVICASEEFSEFAGDNEIGDQD